MSDTCCNAKGKRFWCTEPPGHEGDHIARGGGSRILEQWLQSKTEYESVEAVNSHGLLAEAEAALQKIINKSSPILSGENDKKFSFQTLSSIEEIAEGALARIRAAKEKKS